MSLIFKNGRFQFINLSSNSASESSSEPDSEILTPDNDSEPTLDHDPESNIDPEPITEPDVEPASESNDSLLISGAGVNEVNGTYSLSSGTHGSTDAVYTMNDYKIKYYPNDSEWKLSNSDDTFMYYTNATYPYSGTWNNYGEEYGTAPTVTEVTNSNTDPDGIINAP